MSENPKFEDGLEQLEALVEALEGGELDLDEALKRFEKGVKLAKQLNSSLEDASRSVEKLMIQRDGSAETEALDGDDEPGPRAKKAKKKKGEQDTLF